MLQLVQLGPETLPRARMDREDHRRPLAQAHKLVGDSREALRVVDVRGPVQGDEDVTSRLDPNPLPRSSGPGKGLEPPQRVDHRVADIANALGRDTLAKQVRARLRTVSEEKVGDAIG